MIPQPLGEAGLGEEGRRIWTDKEPEPQGVGGWGDAPGTQAAPAEGGAPGTPLALVSPSAWPGLPSVLIPANPRATQNLQARAGLDGDKGETEAQRGETEPGLGWRMEAQPQGSQCCLEPLFFSTPS